jgi:hypothetical protein
MPRGSATRGAISPAAVALLLFGSGACALVYQVAWMRLLRLVFGGTTAASGAVLAIFLGGLGFGGLFLGRRADAAARPLRWYAMLELGVALAAAASPLLVMLARHLYIALGGVETLGMLPATAVRLLLSALVLGIPTLLMGGTLPAGAEGGHAARRRARRRGRARRRPAHHRPPLRDQHRRRRRRHRVGHVRGARTAGHQRHTVVGQRAQRRGRAHGIGAVGTRRRTAPGGSGRTFRRAT